MSDSLGAQDARITAVEGSALTKVETTRATLLGARAGRHTRRDVRVG